MSLSRLVIYYLLTINFRAQVRSTYVLHNHDVIRYFHRLFENPVVVLPLCWQSTYWFYGLWQLYNRTDYVRGHRPILSLTFTGIARLRSRPTSYFVFKILHAFQLHRHASKHWSNPFSNIPFSVVVTLLRICCEVCQRVALTKRFFFLIKNNFTRSIVASDLGFQRLVFVVGQNLTTEGAVWEEALSTCKIHYFSINYYQAFLDQYLGLNIPKYERRVFGGLCECVAVYSDICLCRTRNFQDSHWLHCRFVPVLCWKIRGFFLSAIVFQKDWEL